MEKVLRVCKGSSRLVYLFLSLAALVCLSYFFAHSLISHPLDGPDNRMNLDYTVWLNHYFPKIPRWWPAEGGGTSFVTGYPILYHLAVVIGHRIIPGLSLVAWMGIWNFLSIALTGIGVYFLAWRVLKNQTAALIAGFFYHLSPLSYILVAKWGFLTHAFSLVFVAPSLLFFDLFSQQRKKKSRWTPVSLLLTEVFLVLAFLTHPITGIGIFMIIGFWLTIESFLISGFNRSFLSSLKEKTVSLAVVTSVFFGLAAFYFFPFYRFINFASRGVNPSVLMKTEHLAPINFRATLGLQKFSDLWDLALAIPVWSLAIFGVFLGFFFKRKGAAFTLLSLLSLGLMSQKSIHIWINKIWPFLGLFFNWRYFLSPTIVLVPIAGAFGIYCLARMALLPLELISKRLSQKTALLVKIPHLITLAGLMFIGSGLIIYSTNFSNLAPPEHQAENILHYGIDFSGVDLTSLWNRPPDDFCRPDSGSRTLLCENALFQKYFDVTVFIKGCRGLTEDQRPDICKVLETYNLEFIPESRLSFWRNQCLNKNLPPEYDHFCLSVYANSNSFWEQLRHPPPLKPSPLLTCHNTNDAQGMLDLYETNPQFVNQSRLYVFSGYNGWNYCWPIKHQASFLNLYTSQLYLNKPYVSFLGDVTNDQSETDYQSRVNNLSQWFGIDSILDKLAPPDSPDKIQSPFWQRKKEFGIYRSTSPVGLASLRFAPRVLVIGSSQKRAYEQFFRLAGLGGFYYQDGTLIEGKERVDDYSLEELSQFNLLILSGHGYRNRDKAWQMLAKYVHQGGSVFLDSGWQYVAADWGTTKVSDQAFTTEYPDFFPVRKTAWGNVGTSWADAKLDFEGVDLNQFSPPGWENQSWSMAVAEMADLTENAKPILAQGNKVVIAQKKAGEGQVIWSGMNLIAHAYDKKNNEEAQFFNKILTSLAKTDLTDINQLWPQRENPDQPVFTINQKTDQPTLLYFREAYHPFWQASLLKENRKKKLKIYSAGPQFMAVILPKLSQNDQVSFKFTLPLVYYLYYSVSLITLFFLVTLLLDSIFRQRKLLKWIQGKTKILSRKLTTKINKTKKDFSDEDY